MANLKISQLPNYTAGTNPDIWFVNNNSGETETSKIQLKEFNSLINLEISLSGSDLALTSFNSS